MTNKDKREITEYRDVAKDLADVEKGLRKVIQKSREGTEPLIPSQVSTLRKMLQDTESIKLECEIEADIMEGKEI